MLFFEVWSWSFENHNNCLMFIHRVCIDDKCFFLKLQTWFSTKNIIIKHHKFCFITADFLILIKAIKTWMFVVYNSWKASIQFSHVMILIFFSALSNIACYFHVRWFLMKSISSKSYQNVALRKNQITIIMISCSRSCDDIFKFLAWLIQLAMLLWTSVYN